MRNLNETKFSAVALTVDTAAYASGDCVGGKLQFTGALADNSRSGLITSVRMSNLANAVSQSIQYSLLIFDSDPTATTFTDNVALDVADADLTRVVAVIDIPTSALFTLADNNVHYVSGLSVPVRANSTSLTGTLFGALVARGAADFDAATDINIQLAISCD